MPPTNRLMMVKDLKVVVERVIDHTRMVQSEFSILSAEAADLSEVLSNLDEASSKLGGMVHRMQA